MKIDGNEVSKEMLEKAMQCDTPEELVKLAKENGVELTKEEAEAYLSEMEDIDLDSSQMKMVAGGKGVCYGVNGCAGRTSSNRK
jgi:predicted ribosomally synthesized peptide with nif11-like leader